MSEYQYLHFIACDRPLDDKALKFMRKQSSRAEISQWEFTNEYQFGDFHGNEMEMMRRGYDAHLHYANFGIRKLMFRLPKLPCDKKTFAAFSVKYQLTWTKDKRGNAGILSIEPEVDTEPYEWEEDIHSLLPKIIPVRKLLLQGDLRPLYMAWLACCDDEDTLEPPVPAGLDKMNPALDAMADFFEISTDAMITAAETAPPMPPRSRQKSIVNKWLNNLKQNEIKQIIMDLALGDAATVQADIQSRIRRSAQDGSWPTAKPSRTLGELKESE